MEIGNSALLNLNKQQLLTTKLCFLIKSSVIITYSCCYQGNQRVLTITLKSLHGIHDINTSITKKY
jgi:hypothetical protein